MVGLTIAGLVAGLLVNGVSTQKIDNVGIYSRTMAVIEIEDETDLVTIADFNGYEWQFEGVEDWLEGDVCSVVMCDNGTPIIEDDVIVSVNYSGWVESWGYDTESKEVLYTF